MFSPYHLQMVKEMAEGIKECKPKIVSINTDYGTVKEKFKLNEPVFGYSFIVERRALSLSESTRSTKDSAVNRSFLR